MTNVTSYNNVSHSVSVMATATRKRIRYHCIVCSSEMRKTELFVALTAVVGHTSVVSKGGSQNRFFPLTGFSQRHPYNHNHAPGTPKRRSVVIGKILIKEPNPNPNPNPRFVICEDP